MWQASQILETFKTIRYISTGFELAVSPQFLSQVSFSWSPSFWLQLLLGPPLDLSLSPPPITPPSHLPFSLSVLLFYLRICCQNPNEWSILCLCHFPTENLSVPDAGSSRKRGKGGGRCRRKEKEAKNSFFQLPLPCLYMAFSSPTLSPAPWAHSTLFMLHGCFKLKPSEGPIGNA